jgi:hypothetical protein
MNRQRPRFYASLAACVLGFGALGFLLGRALRGRPVLAAVMPGLVLVGGALAW